MNLLRRLFGHAAVVPAASAQAAPDISKPRSVEGQGSIDELLSRSRNVRSQITAQSPNLFEPSVRAPLHPVGPGEGMAMDEACAPDDAISAWAFSSILGVISEGVTFLGYPALAEMAQRPEYRSVSEKLAFHMTREWISLKTRGETTVNAAKPGEKGPSKADKAKKGERIAAIEAELRRIGAKEACRQAVLYDGLFGRGHIYIDTGDTDSSEELKTDLGDGANDATQAKIKKGAEGTKRIEQLRAVEAVWAYPTRYNSNDPLQPDWYKPSSWFVMGKELHASRLLTIIGRPVSDLLKPAYSFGGLSMTQMIKPYVDNWLDTRQGVNDIIVSFTQFVLATKLTEAIQGEGGDAFFKRLEFFANIRKNLNVMAIDKDAEDFKNVSAPLGTLDALQAQAQEHQAAASGIPIVLLLGITPKGLNASSEGEIQAFYDWIKGLQEQQLQPILTVLVNMIQLSLFGDIDEDLEIEFNPLWGQTELEEAQTRQSQATTDQIYVDAGIVHPEEVRQRLADDTDSPYHGIDPDDVPEPPMPEGGMFGEGEGGEESGPGKGSKPPGQQ